MIPTEIITSPEFDFRSPKYGKDTLLRKAGCFCFPFCRIGRFLLALFPHNPKSRIASPGTGPGGFCSRYFRTI